MKESAFGLLPSVLAVDIAGPSVLIEIGYLAVNRALCSIIGVRFGGGDSSGRLGRGVGILKRTIGFQQASDRFAPVKLRLHAIAATLPHVLAPFRVAQQPVNSLGKFYRRVLLDV